MINSKKIIKAVKTVTKIPAISLQNPCKIPGNYLEIPGKIHLQIIKKEYTEQFVI